MSRTISVRPSRVLLYLVAFRIANALLVRTFFQPDEFFQSLEPAWRIAFGADSGAWITWEWEHQLRSSVHPYLFAAVYRTAAFFAGIFQLSSLDRGDLLVAAPKVTQGVIAAVGDYYTWRLARTVYGDSSREAGWALGLTVLSPWQWFCSTRTLSNCLETTLTIAALSFWPWGVSSSDDKDSLTKEQTSGLRKCLALAALACVLRPTNLLIWLSLIAYLATDSLLQSASARSVRPLKPLVTTLGQALICGSAVLSLSALADRSHYGVWTLPPLKFVYFNVVQSLAVFYGKNDWHYYLSQGFPLLLTTALPFTIIGVFRSLSSAPSPGNGLSLSIRRQLSIGLVLTPAVLSLIPHKEVRFIYPLLPSLHILAAGPISSYFGPAISSNSTTATPRRLILLFLILINVIIGIYTTVVHASGTIGILDYLRHQNYDHYRDTPTSGNLTAGFLMPCHSTPWRSHLVDPSIDAWALSCEPPVNFTEEDKAAYVDEADEFYNDPRAFLSKHMVRKLPFAHTPSYLRPSLQQQQRQDHNLHSWPDYLIFFAQLEPTIKSFLAAAPASLPSPSIPPAYAECHRTFNTAWHDDWRRQGDVVVYCTNAEEQQKRQAQSSRTQKVRYEAAKRRWEQSFDRVVAQIRGESGASSWKSPESWRWLRVNAGAGKKYGVSWPWNKEWWGMKIGSRRLESWVWNPWERYARRRRAMAWKQWFSHGYRRVFSRREERWWSARSLRDLWS